MTNFQQLKPYRRKLLPGDIFVMQLPDRQYLFGRVVRVDANCFAPNCILIYIFRYRSDQPEPPSRLLVIDLLIEPQLVNRLGWSRGYFVTVDNRPFERGERLEINYFRDSVRSGPSGEPLYVDEDRRPVGNPPPEQLVGPKGLGNYLTVDDAVSKALRIPLAPDD